MSYYSSFGSNNSISSINRTVGELIEDQEAGIRTLESAASNVASDKRSARSLMEQSIRALVKVDDKDRYAELTAAAKAANIGQDYTATVAEWTRLDIVNRDEKTGLVKAWGSRTEVGQKAADVHSEITLISTALADISPQIDAFDLTTAKIKAHNEKYKEKPNAQITEENHDGFEKFKFGAFCKWVVGWCFGAWGGEYNAYRVINGYTKQYGDYYESATIIAKQRKNEEKLEGDKAEKTKDYNQLSGICNRMDQLDGSYKGPTGIAEGIRSAIISALTGNRNLGQALINETKTVEATNATLGLEKLLALEPVAKVASSQLEQAKATLRDLADVKDDLQSAVGRVGNQTVNYDLDNLSRKVSAAAKTARRTASSVNEASDAIEVYQVQQGASQSGMADALKSKGALEYTSNALSLDFGGLKTAVYNEVQEYEREQARLRELERQRQAAIEAERQRKMQETFNDIARAQANAARNNHPTVSTPSYNNSNDDDISSSTSSRRGNDDDISAGPARR
ncbi:MAG: hypothetical protein ACAH80_10765 [Alphaproteobacteria bacterium]